jgi:NAD(P)-dependent dehydrogenase (short-subunit alcohol dehydrogenase family)
LGPRGIRVNGVAPGVDETDMSNFAKTAEGRDYTIGMQHRRDRPRRRRLEALTPRLREVFIKQGGYP